MVRDSLCYEVVEQKDISYAGTPRIALKAVVQADGIPSKEQLEQTASQIYRQCIKKMKVRKKKRDEVEVTVFIYLPDMDTAWSAYGVAEFKETDGLKKFWINDSVLISL
ncbi:MAG: hypothetical protein AB1401_00700 [Thermodesulfobacteriota bacterium]